jgi:hypothetical protein
MRAALLTYTALNDDDDEIRDLAIPFAALIFQDNNNTVHSHTGLAPLIASKKLALSLTNKFADSPALCTAAIERMTGSQILDSNIEPPADQRFTTASQENTALFMVEKQNLFIDPAREAVLWSRVLKRMSKRGITAERAAQLTTWILDSVSLLTHSAASQDDGPLGWTSKPDMFAFGVQVICAADVLLHWRSITRRPPVGGNVLRRALWDWLEAGKKSAMHPIWIDMLEQVLETAVLRRLNAVHGVLRSIEASLSFSSE